MLKRLVGENYQSHQYTEIKFSPKITVIIGSSDAGKTSVLRMIRWVLFNRPLGSSILRRGSKGGCSVTVETGDGVLVGKKRDSGGSIYFVGADEFDKVSSSVPVQVTEQLNLDEINFQNQLEPHFLVLQSGGQIASYINNVLKMDILSTATQLATSQIKKAEKSIEDLKSRRDYAKKMMDVYAPVKDIEKQVEKLSALNEDLDNKLDDEKELQATVNAVNALDEQIASYGNVKKYENAIVTLNQVIEDIDDLGMEMDELDDFIRLILSLDEEIEVYHEDIQDFEGKLELLLNDYDEVLQDMGNCPLCGQEMSDDAIEFRKEGVA